ncbi:hypothetical protein CEPID_10885 [Corynebacterium epidermidicanis]|uniref:Uncharacterized protein n=1 Tax=Corynebacterium epidermidicanis TaxID=1050174 RepID=A0A0G3GS33_9CORY|nr:hypothetical protein CEPID_10885 [Corynebacterium epidermidicanis]
MSRSSKVALVALGMLVVFALGCFWALNATVRPTAQPALATPSPTPTSSSSTPTPTRSSTVARLTTTSATPTSKPTPKPTASTTPTPKAQPPRGAQLCGNSQNFQGYAVNKVTSCGFVNNTAKVMDAHAGAKRPVTVAVKSDATAKTYQMRCAPGRSGEFTCTGGDNATVFLMAR